MKDPIASAYDEWSARYDADENATRDLDARAVRALAPALLAGDVLEVGCGTGKNTVFLAEKARSVLALDFSEGMLARARERVSAPHVRFARHDLRERWPAADASFDLVTTDLVLEHVRDLAPVFREAARVLRPGGHFFVSELHPFRQLLGRQARFAAPDGSEVKVDAFAHSVAEFLTAALDAGLALAACNEWRKDEEPPTVPPRLFALLLRRDG